LLNSAACYEHDCPAKKEIAVGIFDQMFGSGAKAASGDANAQHRFQELKQKYQPVLRVIEQQNVQLENLHVQDNKLLIRGIAPSEDAKNKVWDQIKLVDPQYSNELTADIQVRQANAQAAAVGGGGAPQQTYKVQPGDTLSKISERLYGDAHEFMRIFYANRDKLTDPNKIAAGQELLIPKKTTT
jgi:nucleoid-associated protein YgaU